MALFSVVVDKRVRKKDLPVIPTKDRKRIVARIKQLAHNPYPADSIKLKGRKERRIRQGNYRILYSVKETSVTVIVIKIGHRRDIYKSSKTNRLQLSVMAIEKE